MKKLKSENVYISSFQASKIYSHNFRGENIKFNKIGSIPMSLELIKLKKEGFYVHESKINGKLTSRDIINVDFKFKLDSSETISKKAKKKLEGIDKEKHGEVYDKLNEYIKHVEESKWEGISQEDLRHHFYQNGFFIKQVNYETGEIFTTEYVFYKRSGSKSRTGRALFIRKELKDVMEKWSNMGLTIPENVEGGVDLASIMAYQSLVSSGIKYVKRIQVKNIFLISDVDSRFKNFSRVIKSNDEGVLDSFGETVTISNSLFDGQSLLMPEYFPEDKSMVLLRQHFFKSAAFKCDIQSFLRHHCPKGVNFNEWRLRDMFGNTMYAKNIHMVTTPNSLKALKFNKLLGDKKTQNDMYKYWKVIVRQDGEFFGVCKNEYSSKRGENLQQMSYQMLNSLTLTKSQVKELSKFELDYIDKLKNNDGVYIDFLRKNADDINSNMLWVRLYEINKDIAGTKQFKDYKNKKISVYVSYVKSGKIRLVGDYCVMIGNGYEMLLHTIGKLPVVDGVLDFKYKGVLKANQMYTNLHEFGREYTCFRNPHTSKSNVGILHNSKVAVIEKYFTLSKNMVLVNSINFPLQDIFSGADFDSDTIVVFDNETLLDSAKKCFGKYPIAYNAVEADKNKYQYTNSDKARLDNILSKSQRNIGEVVNLGQLCMSKLHDQDMGNEDLLKKTDVMTVLSCICIDLAKKFYALDIQKEIDNVRNSIKVGNRVEKPLFWSYVSDGVDRSKLIFHKTPMDYLVDIFNGIKMKKQVLNLQLEDFVKKYDKQSVNYKQIKKVEQLLAEFMVRKNVIEKEPDKEAKLDLLKKESSDFTKRLLKIKISETTMGELVYKIIVNKLDINIILNALSSQQNFEKIWLKN